MTESRVINAVKDTKKCGWQLIIRDWLLATGCLQLEIRPLSLYNISSIITGTMSFK